MKKIPNCVLSLPNCLRSLGLAAAQLATSRSGFRFPIKTNCARSSFPVISLRHTRTLKGNYMGFYSLVTATSVHDKTLVHLRDSARRSRSRNSLLLRACLHPNCRLPKRTLTIKSINFTSNMGQKVRTTEFDR